MGGGVIDHVIAPQHPQTAVFHSFPKIHKGGFPPSIRPIVAGINSLSERLWEWLDSYLQPLIPLLPGFLRDTKQVLNTLEKFNWPDNAIWITADVMSLYSVISHCEAILALEWFLFTYSEYDVELRPYLCLVAEYL